MIDDDLIRSARKLCFFAHFHQDGLVAEYVLFYLAALQKLGFTTVVLSTANLTEVEASKFKPFTAGLVLRDNIGMDFGGWVEACRRFFPIRAELLLLANDSVYGPVGDLGKFLDDLTSVDADFYGAVESLEIARHLQSWFVLLRPSAYNSSAFRELMCRPMPLLASKWELVDRYEVGLTQALVTAGLRFQAAVPIAALGVLARAYPFNVMHLLWKSVAARGVPFIKIELLRVNQFRVPDTDCWPQVVSENCQPLKAMIEADLVQRGQAKMPSVVSMSRFPPIYWPELRFLVVREGWLHHRPSPVEQELTILLFRILSRVARIPRRAAVKLKAALNVLVRSSLGLGLRRAS